MHQEESPKPVIIQKITTGLSGWNLCLMVAFITLVLLTQTTNLLMGRVQDNGLIFLVCVVISLIIGVIAGYYGARRLYRYFSQFQLVGSFVWLSVMIYLTLTTLPTRLLYLFR